MLNKPGAIYGFVDLMVQDSLALQKEVVVWSHIDIRDEVGQSRLLVYKYKVKRNMDGSGCSFFGVRG